MSNLRNPTKKKNLSNVDLTMVVKLPNSISFENRILKLINEPNKVTYRYIITETKNFFEPETRFFESETIYNERRQNFLKNRTFVVKYKVRLILGFDFDEKSIYEFRLKNETVNMTI